jgi:hypothetical protein
MNDSTRPGGSFASYQRRRAFATQGRGQFTAQLPILVIQVGLTESVCELGDLIETALHVFWDVLGWTPFRHSFLLHGFMVAHQR